MESTLSDEKDASIADEVKAKQVTENENAPTSSTPSVPPSTIVDEELDALLNGKFNRVSLMNLASLKLVNTFLLIFKKMPSKISEKCPKFNLLQIILAIIAWRTVLELKATMKT